MTVDRLVRERSIPRVDLVKIDTASTEPDVLDGLRGTLGRDRPWIVCEVLKGRGAEERLGPVLGPLGYRSYRLTPDGPIPRTRIEGSAVAESPLRCARRGRAASLIRERPEWTAAAQDDIIRLHPKELVS